jgi:hypothetical protein
MAADQIQARSAALLLRRRIREQRQPPLPPGTQNLIWLHGEALCVTRDFQDALDGQVPDYFDGHGQDPGYGATRRRVTAPGAACGELVRRSSSRPLRWLWCRLRGRTLVPPELEDAGTLFRLQRYGVKTIKILAMGQRHGRPWQTQSFLLTAKPTASVGAAAWLAAATIRRRRQVLRQAGDMLRRMHEAGYYLGNIPAEDTARFFEVSSDRETPQVFLNEIPRLRRRRPSRSRARADLLQLLLGFGSLFGAADRLRFFLAFLGRSRLTAADRKMALSLLHGEKTR